MGISDHDLMKMLQEDRFSEVVIGQANIQIGEDNDVWTNLLLSKQSKMQNLS